jgi:hypothetical protein
MGFELLTSVRMALPFPSWLFSSYKYNHLSILLDAIKSIHFGMALLLLFSSSAHSKTSWVSSKFLQASDS